MRLSIGLLTLLFAVSVAVAQQPALPTIPGSDGSAALLATLAPDGNAISGGQIFSSESVVDDGTTARIVTKRQWEVFSSNLERALGSGHEGMQTAAMRLIIQYGDNVRIGEEAVFDLMRLYRSHDDERVRRMAVVTMGELHSRKTIGYLERAVHFEKSPTVKKTMQSVIANHHKNRIAS